MHVEKLAVCPFCKRSEFEDTVYAHMPRHELLAEDLKAAGAPEREYNFDYNRLYLVHGRNTSSRYSTVELTPCAGNHKHEWERCNVDAGFARFLFVIILAMRLTMTFSIMILLINHITANGPELSLD